MASDSPSSQDPKSNGSEPERRRTRNVRRKSGLGFAAAVSGLLVILFGSFYVLVVGIGGRASGAEYALVIDAGSSGTRIHLYKWQHDDDVSIPAIEKIRLEEDCKKTETGLSELKPGDIDKSLEPLIRCARSELIDRVEDLKAIPLYLMATAGMRLLESDDEPRHAEIMKQVRANLKGAPFDFRNASTIDAREEALYAWVAANYLNGSLATKTENGMIGILELGGASGQIAFVPQDPKPEDTEVVHTEVVHISGTRYKVYARGYDGVGKTKIVEAFENEKLCFPTNYPMVGGGVGEGDYDECQNNIIAYMRNTKQPVFQQLRKDTPPEYDGRFLAISNFVFTPNVFGQENVMNYINLGTAGSKYCSTDWDKIGKEYPKTLEEYRSEYCLMAAYIPALLTNGFRVKARKKDNELRVKLRLDGSKADVDWTLGALILLLH